jgi:nickel transport protein
MVATSAENTMQAFSPLPAAHGYDENFNHHTASPEESMHLLSVVLLATVFALIAATPALAHDYWFERDDGHFLLHRGHKFSRHGGEEIVPYDPRIVTASRCLQADGQTVEPPVDAESYPLRFAGPCVALLVTADSGFWSQTLTGTKNQPQNELFGVLRSWQANESVKQVEQWHERLLQPLAAELELVFTEDPFSRSPGEKLRLVATLDGKAVGGVTVAYDGDPRGITGNDGRINLRIRHTGLQVISASLEQPFDGEQADQRVRSTILMFDIK